MKLQGKRVIITGASSGIGLELARQLLQEGCTVVDASINIEDELSHKNLFHYRCDLSKLEEVEKLFSFALKQVGSIDLFIANAGFAYYEKIGNPDWAHIEKIFNTNVIGMIYCAEKMKELHGKEAYNFVVTASAMSFMSFPGYSIYSGTKAAVRGFAEAYRFELEEGQNFQVVYPISTRTNFFKNAGGGPEPWPVQSAEVVASYIVKGIKADKKSIFPSKLFQMANNLNGLFPFVSKLYIKELNNKFRTWCQSSIQK